MIYGLIILLLFIVTVIIIKAIVLRKEAQARNVHTTFRNSVDGKSASYWYKKGCDLIGTGQECAEAKEEEKSSVEDFDSCVRRAILCFNRATKIDAGYSQAWTRKALALYYLGDEEQAEDCARKALSIDTGLETMKRLLRAITSKRSSPVNHFMSGTEMIEEVSELASWSKEFLEYEKRAIEEYRSRHNVGKRALTQDERVKILGEAERLRRLSLLTNGIEKKRKAVIEDKHEGSKIKFETCPHCGTHVLRMTDGRCPHCRRGFPEPKRNVSPAQTEHEIDRKPKRSSSVAPGKVPLSLPQGDITQSLSDREKVVAILAGLKKLRPSDRWLDQEITTGWSLVRRNVWDEGWESICQPRKEVAEYVSVEEAASRAVSFWEKPEARNIFPGYYDPREERRGVSVIGRKLQIRWKGSVGGEYGNRIPNEWRLTIARVDSELYAVVREQIH